MSRCSATVLCVNGRVGLVEAGDGAQQRRLAPAIGCDDPEPVPGIEREIEIGKQRRAEGDAEIADIDNGHGWSLV